MRNNLHPSLRKILGHQKDVTDKAILTMWKKKSSTICKPCWELKYCPYGPMVEDFPLLPPTRAEMEEHIKYLQQCLTSGNFPNGTPLDPKCKKLFRKEIQVVVLSEYPESIPETLTMMSCRIFGHICPVFTVAEPFTETKQIRRHSRYIPREIMLKVVRRDGQMCQVCHKYVPDNELDFDHVIPHAKGGSVAVENLRVVHNKCNKKKGDSLDTFLDVTPLCEQYIMKKSSKRR